MARRLRYFPSNSLVEITTRTLHSRYMLPPTAARWRLPGSLITIAKALSIAITYSVLAISISFLAAWWILARGGGGT